MYKVLIVDEQLLVRKAMGEMIEDFGDFRVVAHAASAREALDQIKLHEVDVVVMEWRLSGMGGIEVLQRIGRLARRPRVLVCTAYFESPLPSRVMQAGADVLVSRNVAPSEFEYALRCATRGVTYLSQDVQPDYIAATLRRGAKENPFGELSDREFQVLMMYVEGEPIKDIAAKLCISPKTVCTYRYRACEKLGVKGEAALARLALRYGVMEPQINPTSFTSLGTACSV